VISTFPSSVNWRRAQLPLGDALEPGPLEVVGTDAPLGGGPLGRQVLEQAPRHSHNALVLADLDPELHRPPLGIPAGVLGERRLGSGVPRAILPDTIGRRICTSAKAE
jgi:hypothetical protein